MCFNVTVNLNDECSITGPDNVCPNSTNTYTGPPTLYPYNPYSYSWSVSSGSAVIVGSSTSQNVQVQAPPNNSAYTLSLTVTNLCGTTTCTHTYQSSNPLPTCNITGGADAVCAGSSTTWSATAGMTAYSWTGPGGFTATTQNITITVAGTYTVTITGANGCQSTCSRTLNVTPLPAVAIYHR